MESILIKTVVSCPQIAVGKVLANFPRKQQQWSRIFVKLQVANKVQVFFSRKYIKNKD